MKINRFEDIEVWKLSRIFVKEIYSVTNNNPFSKDFGLKDQLRRASISIMSNIRRFLKEKGRRNLFTFYICQKVQPQKYIHNYMQHMIWDI